MVKDLSKVKIIAVEIPFLISYLPVEPMHACAYKDGKVYVYDTFGNLLAPKDYNTQINVIEHAVKEGKYEFTDFLIEEGQIIARDYDYNILVDSNIIDTFDKDKVQKISAISNLTLKLFNEFLKTCNKDNKDMVEALKISFQDGFFRKEVEDIVKNDVITELSNLDKEIIVRSKIEGEKYIVKYVKKLLTSESYDKYIDINYYFRRLFNLEIYQYIAFEAGKEGQNG